MTDRNEREVVFVALCDHDLCPWKHRGLTLDATDAKGREHCRIAGHNVAVYTDHTLTHRIA